jgi:hypothetical protein
MVERESLVQVLGNERETKFLLGITLRGIGSLKKGNIGEDLIHRKFESIR